jgi:hypothetical protein
LISRCPDDAFNHSGAFTKEEPVHLRTWDDHSTYLHLFIPMLIEATIVLDQQLCEGPNAVQQALVGGLGFSPANNLFAQANDVGVDAIITRIEQDAGSFKALHASSETVASLQRRLAD